MSIAALQWAFNLDLPDHTCKVVLLALADHYNDQSQCCWPSLARLQKFTGANERTVQRAIGRLEELGHVTREERAGSSSLFYLDLDPPPSNCHPSRQADTPPPSTRRPTPVNLTGHPRQSDTQNPYLTPTEPSVNSPSGSPAPDGARPLTSREEWQARLEGYDPHNIRATWKPFWGPRPDAVGSGHIVPDDLLRWWRAQRAQQQVGAA